MSRVQLFEFRTADSTDHSYQLSRLDMMMLIQEEKKKKTTFKLVFSKLKPRNVTKLPSCEVKWLCTQNNKLVDSYQEHRMGGNLRKWVI